MDRKDSRPCSALPGRTAPATESPPDPDGPSHARQFPLWQIIALGGLLTLAHVLLGGLLSGVGDLQEAYGHLFEWDGGWYLSIVEWGYFSADYPNTAFLPGYPLTARLVKDSLGVSGKTALLLTAQLGSWAFWVYLLLFLRRWAVPRKLALAVVLAIWAHPAAFYLVASYSESLFLALLLGFLYWADSRGLLASLLASLHGCGMTATRVVGAPLAAYPVIRAWLTSERRPRWNRALVAALLVGSVATLGTLGYFAFCQWRFGHWDMYMKSEQAAWKVHAEWLAPFTRKVFKLRRPSLQEAPIDPRFLDRLSAPLLLLLFAALIRLEWRAARSGAGSAWRQRAGYFLCALLLYYITVTGRSCLEMWSMVRYSLCIFVVYLLAAVHLLARAWPLQGRLRKVVVFSWSAWCIGAFLCEMALAYRFTHGKWVA
jgi:hypothetical protein